MERRIVGGLDYSCEGLVEDSVEGPSQLRPGVRARRCSGSGRLRQFGAEHLDPFDDRRRRQQVRRLRHQRLRNRPVEVGLTSGLIRERVEHAERRRTQAEREPDRCRGLPLRELEALLEKRGDLALLPGFGLETNQQTDLRHLLTLLAAAPRRSLLEITEVPSPWPLARLPRLI